MWQLVKKDFPLFAVFSVPLQLLLSLAWLLIFNELNVAVVLIQVMFVFFTVMVLTSHSEQMEENNNGYEFLKNLPVSALEIIAAKFFLIFSTLLFLTFSNILLFSFLGTAQGGLRVPVAFLILVSCAVLVLSALVHLGITVLGGDHFFRATSALVVAMVALYVILFEKKKMEFNRIIEGVITFLKNADLPIIFLISLAAFLILMIMAVFVSKTGRFRILKKYRP